MRKNIAIAVAVSLVFAICLPALAAEGAKEVSLTGWITDDWCGAKNANASGKSCALACAKKGAALVLYSDGKTYKLSDQKAAMGHVGVEVKVTGTLTEDGTVKVQAIEEVKDKA